MVHNSEIWDIIQTYMLRILSGSPLLQMSQSGDEMSAMFFNIGNIRAKSNEMGRQGICCHKSSGLIGGKARRKIREAIV